MHILGMTREEIVLMIVLKRTVVKLRQNAILVKLFFYKETYL